MTLVNQTWAFRENNDEVVNLAFTDPNTGPPALPVNITGMLIEVFFKTDVNVADSAPTAKYSTVTGEVVITDGPNGLAVLSIPASFTATPTTTPLPVFKVDLISGGKRKTCSAGTYSILNT